MVLAEPAVHVLTQQVEEVTSGYIKRKVILMALSSGIALAVAMSMLRIMIPTVEVMAFSVARLCPSSFYYLILSRQSLLV